ncbi:MAG TPA: hypothetical protein VIG33_17795 [Pseudobdellovibrionaceae bacterium]|jgi:hypothetical protein
MKKIILAIAMVLGVSQAHAHSVPAWVCSLSFKGEAEGFKLIYGDYAFNGKGDLLCANPAGKSVAYPVIVTMNSKKLSPQVSFGRMRLSGQAVEFSLFNHNPEDVLGTYYIAQGQAAVVGGIGAITATKVHLPEIALHISLQFARGLGVNLGLNKMVIALDSNEAPAPTPVPEEPIAPAPAPAPAPTPY